MAISGSNSTHRPPLLRSRISLRDLPRTGGRLARHLVSVASGGYRRNIGALALIRDPHGRILLARPTYPPRLWNLPGGRVERDETPDQALVRELMEETGLEIRVDRLLLVDVSRRTYVTFTFACSVIGGSLVPSAGEIAAIRWIDESDLPRLSWRVRMTVANAIAATGGVRYIR